MVKKREETVLCQICKGEKRLSEVIPAELVRQPIVEIIKKTHPEWSPSGNICMSDLNQFRHADLEAFRSISIHSS